MNTITLHTAATRNDGSYADAGTTLVIGDKNEEISADRAQALADNYGGSLDDPDGDILEQFTIAELRETAEREKADLDGATRKAAIIAAIRANREQQVGSQTEMGDQ